MRVTIDQDFELDEYLKLFWDILQKHRGHKVSIVSYGDNDVPANIVLECEDCGEVILDAGIYMICARKDKKYRNDKTITNNIQLSKAAEELLEAMKTESLRMIESTHVPSVKNAWYYSHLGSLDFARQMGFISEERRQELCREFSRTILNLITKL